MKKILIAVITMCISFTVFSQVNFFAEGGINHSKPVGSSGKLGAPAYTGLTDINVNIGIVKKIGSSLQLNNRIGFLSKSYNESFFVGPDYSGSIDFTLWGIQDHLMLEQDLLPKKKMHIWIAGGAYATIHVGGNLHSVNSTIIGPVTETRDLDFGNDGDFSRWDAGLSAGLRFQYKKFSLGGLLDLGLMKISSKENTKWFSGQLLFGYFLK